MTTADFSVNLKAEGFFLYYFGRRPKPEGTMKNQDTVPKRVRAIAEKYADNTALMVKNEEGEFESITYRDFFKTISALGTGLSEMGIKRGDHVAIISDNRMEWIITDLALLGIGAVDVPRGSDSTADEISYIISHSESSVVFAENAAQVKKIISKKKEIPGLKKIIVYSEADNLTKKETEAYSIVSFDEVMKSSEKAFEKNPDFFDSEVDKGSIEDIATLIYTSGTTGTPKGVMLHHGSFIFQLDRVYDYVDIRPDHKFLSILPVWHSFERAVEYFVFGAGAALAYSKPVGAVMIPDMAKVQPQWMASVPRKWEGVRASIFRTMNKEGGAKKALFNFFVTVGTSYSRFYNLFHGLVPNFKIRIRWFDITVSIIPLILLTPLKLLGDLLVFSKIKAKLGGRFIAGISGGGALPPYVDSFFQAAGISLLEGYGLTETGPVLAVRKQKHPVVSTVGPLFPDVEYRVIDRNGELKGPGEKGTLFVKSDQVMKGYYKQPEATKAVLKDGWLDTGDICITTHNREVKIIGRSKETIVLMGGENIEPVPIEDRLNASEAILQSVVLGQDKKFLGALIVPDMEKIEEVAAELGISYIQPEELLSDPEIEEFIHNEIQAMVNTKTGFKPFECIFRFKILPKPLEVGKELTQTLKTKRDVVNKLYEKEIKELFR